MDAGNYCSICDRYFSSAYNRKRHVLRKHMDHDDKSNGSDTEERQFQLHKSFAIPRPRNEREKKIT